MIRYFDPLIEKKLRRRARIIARRLKRTGFDHSETIGSYIRFEGMTFGQGSKRPEIQISAELAEVLIREEFEGLYGMSPEAYGKTVNQEKALKEPSIEEDAIETFLFMKFIEDYMGRET